MKKNRVTLLSVLCLTAVLLLTAVSMSGCADPEGSEGLQLISVLSSDCSVRGMGDCTDTEVVIPRRSAGGKPVTKIMSFAFQDEIGIISITIPDSVTEIESYAFHGCTGLKRVTLPEGLTVIEEAVFSECASLESITLPAGVTAIENHAFYACTSLTEVTIPAGVTTVGRCAFDRCDSLTDVYYSGTKEQWYEITKEYGNLSLTTATIHCTDGDILAQPR